MPNEIGTKPTTGQRVLLVDDEETVRMVVGTLLDGLGIEFVAAASIAEARAEIERCPSFDVAVIDKNLPDGSGLELVAELRERHPGSECILITAYASVESVIEAVELGIYDYVPKPFDIRALELRLQNALRKVSLERERAESETRYRQLFAGAADGILLVDAATDRIEDANPAALRMYGYELDGIRGQQLSAIYIGERETATQPDGAAATELHRRADGSRFPAEVSRNHVTVAGRRQLALTVRDVSAREELETELRQAQKMSAIGRLAGGIAHDFNNLLAVILGYSDLLTKDLEGDSDQAEFTQEIKAAAETAAGLTRQLLSFSRKKPVRLSVMQLNDSVGEVEGMLQRTLGKNITLEVSLATQLRSVRADPDHISQILLNLALNARDAMPNGGTLSIATRNVGEEAREELRRAGLDPGSYVRMTVTDTGGGMTDEVSSRAFEPFFTTKEIGAGTGLGLAVVYGLMEQLSGGVAVESRLGTGSSFHVFFPAADGDREPVIVSDRPADRATAAETVLVVDDEDRVRRLVCHILTRAGYTVLEASRGDEALGVLAANPGQVDVLLTDILMPGITGRVLAERVAQSNPELPVVFMSGYPASLAGHDDKATHVRFIRKPFTEDLLLEQLRQALAVGG